MSFESLPTQTSPLLPDFRCPAQPREASRLTSDPLTSELEAEQMNCREREPWYHFCNSWDWVQHVLLTVLHIWSALNPHGLKQECEPTLTGDPWADAEVEKG